MSTTCQTIVTRAVSFSPLNVPLADDKAEMLSRIRADQQALFTTTAALTRDRFTTTLAVTSTAAASARTISIASLTLPLERILDLTLTDGREVSQVDVLDTDAELAPRYFVRGLSLIEVSNDWNTASSAAVTGTLTYVYGATDIDPDGAYTQAVTVPDQFTDLLVLPLAIYLAAKDPGRDPNETAMLRGMLAERTEAWLAYLKGYGGITSRRFDEPSPLTSPEQKR